ncbi:MAG: FtsX-like permease family protein [Bacteroidales bacterium]
MLDEERAESDRSGNSILINEQMVKDFGWDEPIGKRVTMYDTLHLTVTGVVENYYSSGLWGSIEPSIMRLPPNDTYSILVVRASAENLEQVQEYLRARWTEHFPFYVYRGIYQEETLQEGKDINSSILKVNMFLAIVATLLSLIGVYSLVSLNVLHRTREIGIRNVVGSPVGSLIYILSRKFIIILLIASVLGSLGGYFLSLSLLDSIWDYFITITAWIPLFSVAVMFLATALTVSGKTYRAATQNPVTALQTE